MVRSQGHNRWHWDQSNMENENRYINEKTFSKNSILEKQIDQM